MTDPEMRLQITEAFSDLLGRPRQWTGHRAYRAGDVVSWRGLEWCAVQWTIGEQPGASAVWDIETEDDGE